MTGLPRPPVTTYRLQVNAAFTLDDAAALCDYVASLGASHLYLSPLLQPAPGSTHGYDVIAHDRVNDEAGGAAALGRLTAARRVHGLGAVLDVVPNHMALPVPESLNLPLWDYLTRGDDSDHAGWFDVDPLSDTMMLLPVLGRPLGECLDDGEIRYDDSGSAPVLRYYEHVFPVEPGTGPADGVAGPGVLEGLLRDQNYRLAFWRTANEELNYRRFFDVSSLVAIRVEDPEVFAATHELVVTLVADGSIDGLRIDHPDGLADPRGYLRMLADATGGAWVVVEKILEPGETLPRDWPCAGTTGYDAMREVGGLFVDPAGEGPMTALYAQLTGEPADFDEVADAGKRLVVKEILGAEIERLLRLLRSLGILDVRYADHTPRQWRTALEELLVAFDVYRAYVTPGEEPREESVTRVEAAANRAVAVVPERTTELGLLVDLALGRDVDRGPAPARELKAELVTRFQQTTGPVLAKGIEDTAFYRYHRLTALNEVGGDPSSFGTSVADFHTLATDRQREWPTAMTSLSTHDTKRAEDVRARLAVLSELPTEWGAAVRSWRALADRHRSPAGPDANAEYLFWQTLVGAWPLSAERALAYLEKATREAKQHTSWVDPDEAYDAALADFVTGVLGDDAVMAEVDRFVTGRLLLPGRVNTLAQKLVQLVMPGVPDVYQGSECWDLSLVDPDNRRPVDFATRRSLLAALDDINAPLPTVADDSGAAKMLVTMRTLRLRRKHPEWFGPDAGHRPLTARGAAADHVVAFGRADTVVAVVPRLVVGLEHAGGWGDTVLTLPIDRWTDVLTGASSEGGDVALGGLLDRFPVALLVRQP